MATFAEQVVENNIEQMKRESLDAKTQSMLGENGHHIIGHRVGFVVLVGIVPLGTMIVTLGSSRASKALIG